MLKSGICRWNDKCFALRVKWCKNMFYMQIEHPSRKSWFQSWFYLFCRDEIEKKLRSLRKKIEIAKKEDLEGLATAEGAAGFRKQLFNCISCDKRILMRMKNPILPESTAFPARLSLRSVSLWGLFSYSPLFPKIICDVIFEKYVLISESIVSTCFFVLF